MSCLPSVLASFRQFCSFALNANLRPTPSNRPAGQRQTVGFGSLGLALAVLAAFATGAAAQSLTFPPTAVGTASQAVTVAVNFQTTGEAIQVRLVTLGAEGMDFAAGSGATCQAAERFANQTCQQSVVFTPARPGLRLGAVVLVGDNGIILGTTYISGIGQGGLGVLVPGNTITSAGSYRLYTSTKDGIPATSANLWEPSGVAFDGSGAMYVADNMHNKIRVVAAPVSPATVGIIDTFAGTGDAGFSGDGGQAKNADLNNPSAVAVDGAGNLYIADTGNNRIRKITPSGIITTIAGNGVAGFAGDNQPADGVNTEFNNPLGVTVDYAGNLYIADTNNQRIRRIDALTGVVTTVAGNGAESGLGDGNGTYTGDGGPAGSAGLSLPFAVAFDASGNMFIPDSANQCVRRVDVITQAITTVAGTGGKAGYKGDGAAATAALLDVPSGVAVDPAGNLYIADTQNSAIRKVNFKSGKISTLVSSSFGSSLASTGSPGPVQIYAPIGLYLDGNGNLYFADRYNMIVREIESSVGVLNFTSTPVFLGQQSATPLVQTLENDGNAAFILTSLTNDQNAIIDQATTTCNLIDPLQPESTCSVGAFFAPSTSVVIPAGKTLFQVAGNVDAEGTTPNSPLDIIVVGNAAPTNATAVTLTSNPANPTYGQNVTFKATVSSPSATPVGTVAFTIDGVATVPASINVSSAGNNSAVATYTTTTPLSVGKHAIAATFTAAKNANFLPGDGAMTVEVDAATTTTLTSSVNGSTTTLGNSVTFTAKVSVTNGAGVNPDGTVIFYDGLAVLGSPVAIDAAGLASVATNSLATGQHSITAVFSGDLNNFILGSSTATALKLDVQGASTLALSSSPNPSVYGDAVTFLVTVTSNAGTPATGTVTFTDGATQIGTAALAGDPATASFPTSSLTAGSHSITASYPGDANNAASSASIPQVVNLVPTSTSLTATPNPGIAGHAVTLATVVKPTSGTRVPTGIITFTDASTSLGSVKLAADGTASIAVVLAPGPHAIAAAYSGDANDAPSPSNNLPLEVHLATTSVAVTSGGSPATVLASITFTAVVTGNGATPAGTVVFSIDGAAGSPITLDATGKASFSSSSLAVGSHIVAAAYSGDGNDGASTSSGFTQVVQAIPTTTKLATASTTGTTPQTILVASVVAGTGPTPTGTVVFTNGSTPIGTASVDASGVATLLPDLAPATYNIVAEYSGDAIHGPSTSSAVSVTGTPVGFGMTISPSQVTLAASQNTIVTITFQSNNGFTDSLGLGCGTLPMGVDCHFDSNSVVLKAGGSASVHLTLDTNVPLGGGSTAMNTTRTGFSLAGLFLPAGLLMGWIGWRFRKRNAAVFTALLVLALSAAAMMSGCGGFTQKSAPAGTYTIQVTAVGAGSNVAHYQNITLTITK